MNYGREWKQVSTVLQNHVAVVLKTSPCSLLTFLFLNLDVFVLYALITV